MGVAAVLQLASCAPILSGALLNLATCNPSDQLQQLVVKAGSVGTPDGSLCVAYVGASPEALALLPCDGSQGQTWTFSPSTGAFEGNVAANGACMAWNAQGGNDSVRWEPCLVAISNPSVLTCPVHHVAHTSTDCAL